MHHLTAFIFAILLCAGCPSSVEGPDEKACLPGASIDCTCPDGTESEKKCLHTGTAWNRCQCDANDGGDDGSTHDGSAQDTAPPDHHIDNADAYTPVSFSTDIVPMIFTDCRNCHRFCNWTNDCGQRCCNLIGTVADYQDVMDFVDVNNPEAVHGFLWWADGGGCGYIHPVSWHSTGWQYQLFLRWVLEGAAEN